MLNRGEQTLRAVTGSGGRLHFGMVAGIKSERWPTSNRNPWPDCLGIRNLCAEGASALVIVTEWDAFRALDLARIKDALSEPIIVDLRNIYSPSDMRRRGFRYFSVGRQ